MAELMDERNAEQRLLEKAERGDRQAFDGLMALYEEDLASFISTRVGSQLRKKVEVRDLVQDVVLTAYRSLSRFEPKDERSSSAISSSFSASKVFNSFTFCISSFILSLSLIVSLKR